MTPEVIVGKAVPIQFEIPANIVGRYATNIVIQHTEHEFVLSFFEAMPPPILGDTDKEKQALLDQVESVTVKCIARIVISPDRIDEMVRVLQSNVKDYHARFSTDEQ